MKKAILFFAAVLLPACSYAQSCVTEGVVLGKPTKECLTNVTLPKDAFDNLCTAWEKNPTPGIESKTTYVKSCPEGYAGYCATTFTATGKSMKHYFYNKAIVPRAKKSCTSTNPVSSGVWHDQ